MSVESEGYEEFFVRSNKEYEDLLSKKVKKIRNYTGHIQQLKDELEEITAVFEQNMSKAASEKDRMIAETRNGASQFQDSRNQSARDAIEGLRRASAERVEGYRQDRSRRELQCMKTYDSDVVKVLKSMNVPVQVQEFHGMPDMGRSAADNAIRQHLLTFVENDFERQRDTDAKDCMLRIARAKDHMRSRASAYGADLCGEIAKGYGLDGPGSDLGSSRREFSRSSVDLDNLKRELESIKTRKFDPSMDISGIPMKAYGDRRMPQICDEAHQKMMVHQQEMDAGIKAVGEDFDALVLKDSDELTAAIGKINDENSSQLGNCSRSASERISKLEADYQERVKSMQTSLDVEVADKNTEIDEAKKGLESVKASFEQQISEYLDGFRQQVDQFIEDNNPSIDVDEDFECRGQVREFLPIGYKKADVEDYTLYGALESSGTDYAWAPWVVDMKNGGNIMIKTTPDVRDDDPLLVNALCGYVLKILEEFPAGSVRIHIVDATRNTLFETLSNVLGNNINKEMKYTIDRSISLMDVMSNVDTYCGDVVKKFGFDIRNMYDLYQVDKTDQFNIFVIRAGVDQVVRGSIEALRTLRSLVSDRGMGAGVRFVMVDDIDVGGNMEEKKLELIEDIRSLCKTVEYSPGVFTVDGKECKLSSLDPKDTVGYILNIGKYIVDGINNSKKDVVYYKDIGFGKTFVEKEMSSVLRIPVGKCGNDIAELALNCAGGEPSNIGYTFIGRSGSGKSSMFRSIVLNAAMKYSPDDVNFYLLDFKDGSETKNYEDNKIPHVKYLSMNNKPEDAFCLFKMIKDEITRRGMLYKELGNRNNTNIDNLATYNQFVDANPQEGKHMPRILVMVDEIQRIFGKNDVDEMQGKTAAMIGDVASLGRYAGVHLIIVAQNLSGGASKLHEYVLNHVAGRGMFPLEDNLVSECGFGPSFNELRSNGEIANLKKGEVYVSTDGTPIKVKVGFEKELTPIKDAIHEKYKDYRVEVSMIGNDSLLKPEEMSSEGETFGKLVATPTIRKVYGSGSEYDLCIGEDCFTVKPQYITYRKNSGRTFILGNDILMSGSFMANLLTGASGIEGSKIFVCNGSGKRETIFNRSIAACEGSDHDIRKFALKEIETMIREVYAEYTRRVDEDEQDLDTSDRKPVFVFLHDAVSISALTENKSFSKPEVQKADAEPTAGGNNDVLAALNAFTANVVNRMNQPIDDLSDKTMMSVLKDMFLKGPIHDMFVIVSCMSEDRGFRDMLTGADNLLLFNSINDSEYLLKRDMISMLENVKPQNNKANSMAVSIINNFMSKLRPVMNDPNDDSEI